MQKIFIVLLTALMTCNLMALPGLNNSVNALISAKRQGTQMDSINNLRQIFTGITMYVAANNDMLPTDFSALADYTGGSRIFVAAFDKKSKPASGTEIKPGNTSFAYVGNLGRLDALRNAAATPLAFEKPWLQPSSQRTVTVLFADGHTARIQLPPGTPATCQAVVKILSKKLADKNLISKLDKNAVAEDKLRQ